MLTYPAVKLARYIAPVLLLAGTSSASADSSVCYPYGILTTCSANLHCVQRMVYAPGNSLAADPRHSYFYATPSYDFQDLCQPDSERAAYSPPVNDHANTPNAVRYKAPPNDTRPPPPGRIGG